VSVKIKLIQEVELTIHTQCFDGCQLFSVPATSLTRCNGFNGWVPKEAGKGLSVKLQKTTESSSALHLITREH